MELFWILLFTMIGSGCLGILYIAFGDMSAENPRALYIPIIVSVVGILFLVSIGLGAGAMEITFDLIFDILLIICVVGIVTWYEDN